MINVAIMGYGTIGSGVFEVIRTNADILKKNTGGDVAVKYVLDLREFPGSPVENILVHDLNVILEDPSVDIVVETMGGVEPAFTFVKKALEAGKSVTTSNKALVAAKGVELFETAKAHGVNFFFGASVGGGIPIIRPLLRCLTADRVEEISGILNGTTNYVLSRMNDDNMTFGAALSEAQEKGFAERNPEADVEGHDAGRKIAILASIVTGKRVEYESLHVEGITGISEVDMAYAKDLGWALKLVADARFEEDGVTVLVAPHLVKPEDALYAVNGVFNAVKVHGNMVDDVMFYGQGAGSLPTASAVVADIVEMACHLHETVYAGWSGEPCPLKDLGASKKQFLVRVTGGSERIPELSAAFGGGMPVHPTGMKGETGFVTPVLTEEEFDEKSAALAGVIGRIRVL